MTSTENSNDKPRAVFAPEDYPLILRALKEYVYWMEPHGLPEEMSQAARIIHRLGRIVNE